MMNYLKKYWWALVLVVVVLISFNGYNTLVTLDEQVNGAWAQVENQLQRRFDLIPNLVETVKGYAAHESEVLGALADARARYSGAASVQEKAAASTQLEGALSRLLVIVENYPQLKADSQFSRLQDELAGTENRIAVERMRYNQQVQAFNARIRRLPHAIYASIFGFSAREYFQPSEGAVNAPKVEF